MEKGDAIDEEFEAMIKTLPKEKNLNYSSLYLFHGYWFSDFVFRGVVYAQKIFTARDNDIVLTSCPKSGTTWLKALVFTIVNRTRDDGFSLKNNLLLEKNPHDLVPNIHDLNFLKNIDQYQCSSPRVLSTHIPYKLLPHSIKASNCKIVYIYRNPMDLFVSMWHFAPTILGKQVEARSLEECFDRFSRGVHAFGPFWDHVLGFSEASLENPEKILILCYEDLKNDPFSNVRKLAEFLGFPFSEDEEKRGVVEEIVAFCSFGKMKNLEVNKTGKLADGLARNAFFRKGEIGDSKNFLTPSMIGRLEDLMQEKYAHFSELKFNFFV